MPYLSRIGFGHQPFGHPNGGKPFQQPHTQPYPMNAGFGHGDWAEEVTWRILPDWMHDEDGTQGDVPEPLRGFIDSVKPILNQIIQLANEIPTLWDANTCPITQLPALAYSIGYPTDPSKSEALQRSEILNATQLYIHKGDAKGYSILAAFENATVEIIPLWASDATSSATLSPIGPSVFAPQLDDVPADLIPLDRTYADLYALWPTTLYFNNGPYRSHSLQLIFYAATNPTQDFDPDVAARIISRLALFKPIHVTIDRITFDALRGSSQVWIQPGIVADNAATGMWEQPAVTAALRGSSQVWIQPDLVGIPAP